MSAVTAPASRNAPCPCGSGRRYKDCHGALTGTGAQTFTDTLEFLMPAALSAQKESRLADAQRWYERALELDPLNFDALHMLGVTHLQRHDYERAATLIAAARRIVPGDPAARHNEGLARTALRRGQVAARYRDWIRLVESPRRAARESALRAAAARQDAPGFSILLPTYNSAPEHLAACLDSVLGQIWPHWEVCAVDDASTREGTRETLHAYAKRDARIRVVERTENGHISAASNSALAMAALPYVALVDHDDLLPGDALAEMAAAILAQPEAAILFSDEDKINEGGERLDPYFKPDWNPVLARAQNCVSHLGVYRTSLLRDVGGFRVGLEGAQDWDLLLRCAERLAPASIVHVPRILYHWRVTRQSTASSMDAKSYAGAAQERAVRDHARRLGFEVELRRVTVGAFLQCDPVIRTEPRIALVVLCDSSDDAAMAAARWRGHAPTAAGIAVVAIGAGAGEMPGMNGSHPLSPAAAERINREVDAANADVVVVVGAHLIPTTPGWLALFASHAMRPDVGVVGGVTIDSDGCPVSGPLILDAGEIAAMPFAESPPGWIEMGGRNTLVQNLGAVRLDALAVQRTAWLAVGGLDVANLECRFQDVDLCLRLAEAGRATVWHPGITFARDDSQPSTVVAAMATAADRDYMRNRHPDALQRDRAYNPNLAPPPHLFELDVSRKDGVAPNA